MNISSRSHLDPTRIPVGSPVEIEVSLPHLWLPVQPGLICASVRWSLAEELLLLRSVGPIWGIAKEIVLGAAKVRTMCQWIGISGYLLQCSKRVLHLGVLASKLGQLGAGVHHPPASVPWSSNGIWSYNVIQSYHVKQATPQASQAIHSFQPDPLIQAREKTSAQASARRPYSTMVAREDHIGGD